MPTFDDDLQTVLFTGDDLRTAAANVASMKLRVMLQQGAAALDYRAHIHRAMRPRVQDDAFAFQFAGTTPK